MHAETGDIVKNNDLKEYLDKHPERVNEIFPISDRDYDDIKGLSPGERKNYMRNKPCPCGKKKKFKKCCWSKYA